MTAGFSSYGDVGAIYRAKLQPRRGIFELDNAIAI